MDWLASAGGEGEDVTVQSWGDASEEGSILERGPGYVVRKVALMPWLAILGKQISKDWEHLCEGHADARRQECE